MGTVWAAALEPDSSSVVKPTVLTRCPQGGWGTGRSSSEWCWVGNAGSRLEQIPQALLGFPPWCAAPHLPSSAAPGALGTELCTHHRCAMALLTAGAADVTSISSSLKGQKNRKHPSEPKNQELGLLYLFMISSCLGLTR